MKLVLLAFAVLVNTRAFATTADDRSVCGAFLTCGTFETLDNRDPAKPVIRGLVVEADGNLQVSVKATTDDGKKVTSIQTWKFNNAGEFSVQSYGNLSAVGTCAKNTCVAAGTWNEEKANGPISQTLIFRFTADSVELNKVHVKSDATTTSTGARKFDLKQ